MGKIDQFDENISVKIFQRDLQLCKKFTLK